LGPRWLFTADKRQKHGVRMRDLPGARPLGLISVKGFCLTTSKLKELSSYGRPSSSRIRTGFQGLGPAAGGKSAEKAKVL
jgi:hypothetical protein